MVRVDILDLLQILAGKAFIFSPLSITLAVGLSQTAFIMLRYVRSISILVRVFIMNECWILSNAFFFFFFFFRAAPVAHGGSQARGGIRATAAGHSHNHSNTGSEQSLQPTPQLMTMPDP